MKYFAFVPNYGLFSNMMQLEKTFVLFEPLEEFNENHHLELSIGHQISDRCLLHPSVFNSALQIVIDNTWVSRPN